MEWFTFIFFEKFFYNHFVSSMTDYILTDDDINYCRKAIEDLDDDGNGVISIFDLETVL